MMKRMYLLLVVTVGLVLMQMAVVALAPPPLPSSFWGMVTVNGEPVAEGTVISAWIGGVKYAEDVATVYAGYEGCYYAFNVPGDQVGTEPIEGGVEGDTIIFRIGDLEAQESAEWHGGTNARLDLTVSDDEPVSCRELCRGLRGWRWRICMWRCWRAR